MFAVAQVSAVRNVIEKAAFIAGLLKNNPSLERIEPERIAFRFQTALTIYIFLSTDSSLNYFLLH